MCYFNGIKVTRAEYIRLTGLATRVVGMEAAHPIDKVFHDGFTFSQYPILRPAGDCEVELSPAIWGFIPHWIKSQEEWKKYRFPNSNLDAQGETLLTKPTWADAARKRRCLIPSSGFYDWRDYKPDGSKKSIKYPYYINVPDRDYFLMAGVWQSWTDRETGEVLDSFAMVTTAANGLMEQVHNLKKRMPTILTDELAGEWISDGLSESRITEIATFQYPSSQMKAYTIHKDFKKIDEHTMAFEYSELPALVA